jgi:hypothetical protein
METLFQEMVKSYGLVVSLFVAAPFIGLTMLWRSYNTLRKEYMRVLHDTSDKLVAETQARVQDSQKVTEALMDLASEQSSLNKETNMLLTHISSVLERLKGD